MTQSLSEWEWGDPLFPPQVDPAFEENFRKRFGSDTPEIYRRIAGVPWMRELIIRLERQRPVALTHRMVDIGTMVTAQENACRYCYGASRAHMRTLGYSERMITQIEREVLIAGLDEKERAFINFSRNLARSNPRPGGHERAELLKLGFSPLAVAEMAALITGQCFINRMATFLAVPPLHDFEHKAGSLRVRLLRPLLARRARRNDYVDAGPLPEVVPHFPNIIKTLEGLPMAGVLHEALQEALAPSGLSLQLKLLMFSVVALTLNCQTCHAGAKARLIEAGFGEEELDTCLATLTSPRLTRDEEKLLAWTRKTVHYQTGSIQKRTRELAQEIEAPLLLEAIGIAALANSVVRLAVLLEE